MPDVVLDTVHSPDNKRSGARNMWRIGINMYEKRTVLQVGYLQEPNRDARSMKHKTNQMFSIVIGRKQ